MTRKALQVGVGGFMALLLSRPEGAPPAQAQAEPPAPEVPAPAEEPGPTSLPRPETPAPPAPQPQPEKKPAPAIPKSGILLVSPAIGAVWRDGQTVTLSWLTAQAGGTVRFYYYGERCKLGGRSRGSFGGIIGGGRIPNTGAVTWKVPWLDGTSLHLRVVVYNDEGKATAQTERKVCLLPREFENLPPTCIAVSKRLQRLWYFSNGEIKCMHMVSTAAPGYHTPRMRPGSMGKGQGKMGQVFYKALNPFSRLYRVHMPYWLAITSSGSHGIHATSPRFYRLLGRPASHGCIRQHRADAAALYRMVSVGTPVYVF